MSENFGEGTRAADTPVYFEKIGLILADLMVSDVLNERTISSITNKVIYRELLVDLPLPKVIRESSKDYKKVWNRLHKKILDSKSKEVMLLLIHNKLPVPERLHHINVKADPYCEACDGNQTADIIHCFSACCRTADLWTWVRTKCTSFSQNLAPVSDWDLLNLLFCEIRLDTEVVWIISNYVWYVWDSFMVHGTNISLDKFFGYLTFKYREWHAIFGRPLQQLNEFS